MAPPKKEAGSKKKPPKVEEIILDPDEPRKPDDQLQLTLDELDELYANAFYVNEPLKPPEQIIYSNRKKKFVPKIEKPKFIKMISLKSTLLHVESAEANIQIENELCRTLEDFSGEKESLIEIIEEEEMKEEEIEKHREVKGREEITDDSMLIAEEEAYGEFLAGDGENEVDEMNETEDDKSVKKKVKVKKDVELKKDTYVSDEESVCSSITSLPVKKLCIVLKLKNKFNFFDRFIQTKTISTQNKNTQTLATKRKVFQTNVLLSGTHSAYEEDFKKEQKKKEDEIKKKMAAHMTKKNAGSKKKNIVHNEIDLDLLKMTKIVEKVVNSYETDAIAQDFRYYEDPSDQFKDKGVGTLMLMWTLEYEKKKQLIVTDISYNPTYFGMFAITLSIPQCYLSLADDPDIGYVCLWLLQNSAYPEFVTETHCGATCLCFNPNQTNCLAVGLRDGSLAVYNLALLTREPQYKSDLDKTRHFCSVKQIVWCKDMPTGEMNFLSVSDDGTVCQWILMQTDLLKIVKLTLTVESDIELGGIRQPYYAMGTTIAFNPDNEKVYLVGTAEGYIYKCHMEWSNFQQRFRAHQMAVNRIDYNNYDSNIFITCSDDYMIKIWEDGSDVPLILMNLMMSLADVRWSPFSSTVFCIITADCRTIIYDMDVSLKTPVCNQLIHPPNDYRLSKLVFNKRVPTVLVGSTNCTVITYKLSPNLRTTLKSPKKGEQISSEVLEYEKLQNSLKVVRNQHVNWLTET